MENEGKECESVGVNKKEKVEKSVRWVQNTVAAQRDDNHAVRLLQFLVLHAVWTSLTQFQSLA